MISRRYFIRNTALGAAAFSGTAAMARNWMYEGDTIQVLHERCATLLRTWADAVLALQVTDKDNKDYGGIWCPADKLVHGRSGDIVYPLMHLAAVTGDVRYSTAAESVYDWTEKHVSQPDGSWLNENTPGSWKGTTVFYAIALAETLTYHGSLLNDAWKQRIRQRLVRAGDFIHAQFHILYGNINYPASAAYAMSLLGQLLDKENYRQKGKQLGAAVKNYFTKKDVLLYGEGDLENLPSPKGCQAIDLGYNVEESLPALLQYALLVKDDDMLLLVKQSMHRHLAFMLPDGGWDNSWGTRNYKWTYYGSRTSDGCQGAYGLLAQEEPVFAAAALRNTELMQACTHNGLLTGGPHHHAQGIPVCVHHSLSHMKALAVMLDKHATLPHASVNPGTVALPRERKDSIQFYEDIQTWLVSHGDFRATVTGYDKEYKKTKNGHATGGAMSLLWHARAGLVLCASMNEYQLFEAGNMQPDTDPHSMPLTPRVEWNLNGMMYANICDLSAKVTLQREGRDVWLRTTAKLVDKNQQPPPGAEVVVKLAYRFTKNTIRLYMQHNGPADDITLVVPVISPLTEAYHIEDRKFVLQKKSCAVTFAADAAIQLLSMTGTRLFNHVPGLQALPLQVKGTKVAMEISVR